ncbi:putative 3-hydroxy-3-methylglutarate-CoA lyase [Trypanosoma vivax]|nr:putative 3-hydroxy-3-methylglutarate-CoA lyase [Trypanosoma vivax]
MLSSRLRLSAVRIVECPRDAMQGLSRFIPTDEKIRYLNGLLKCGFYAIDCASFVSPRAVPQMRDSSEVLTGCWQSIQHDLEKASKLSVVVVSPPGFKRAMETRGVSIIGYPIGCCESFQQRNAKKSISASLEELEQMQKAVDAFNASLDAGKVTQEGFHTKREMLVYISMAFGNPYGEPHSAEQVERMTSELVSRGVRAISLADTVGVARPESIYDTFVTLRKKFPCVTYGAHFHSSTASSKSKLLAAMDAGCNLIDCALGGMGGCPFAKDEHLVGNLATELVVKMLEERNALPASLDREQMKKCLVLKKEIFGISVKDMLISQCLRDEKQFTFLCQEHFKLYDVEDKGALDYEGFRASMLQVFTELSFPPPTEDKIQASFHKVDIQKLGFITLDAYTMGARRLLRKQLDLPTDAVGG